MKTVCELSCNLLQPCTNPGKTNSQRSKAFAAQWDKALSPTTIEKKNKLLPGEAVTNIIGSSSLYLCFRAPWKSVPSTRTIWRWFGATLRRRSDDLTNLVPIDRANGCTKTRIWCCHNKYESVNQWGLGSTHSHLIAFTKLIKCHPRSSVFQDKIHHSIRRCRRHVYIKTQNKDIGMIFEEEEVSAVRWGIKVRLSLQGWFIIDGLSNLKDLFTTWTFSATCAVCYKQVVCLFPFFLFLFTLTQS